MNDLTLSGRARCLLVWLLATGAAALAAAWAAPDLRAAHAALHGDPGLAGQPFDRLVVWLAAAALTACAVWAWLVTGVVVVQALGGMPRAGTPGIPGWLRSAVLLACGLAVMGAGSAAHAADRTGTEDRAGRGAEQSLAGLPPPERVLGRVPPSPTAPRGPSRVHVVRAGDTLWDIAAEDLGASADGALVTAHWQRIHRLNRAVIGADPDLIHPGQQLRIPRPPKDRREEPS